MAKTPDPQAEIIAYKAILAKVAPDVTLETVREHLYLNSEGVMVYIPEAPAGPPAESAPAPTDGAQPQQQPQVETPPVETQPVAADGQAPAPDAAPEAKSEGGGQTPQDDGEALKALKQGIAGKPGKDEEPLDPTNMDMNTYLANVDKLAAQQVRGQ